MITMGSPYFVWINTNGIISSWYLLDAVCVTPPRQEILFPAPAFYFAEDYHQQYLVGF
jgi:hypothetical protein